MRLHAVVAAAGGSARMGFPKALLAPAGGLPLALQWCVAFREAGADVVTCTLPDEADALLFGLATLLQDQGFRVRPNRHPERGLLGSVQTALVGVTAETSLAVVPVDTPFRAGLVGALLDHARRHAGHTVRPHHGGVPGHPVVLPPAVCAALSSLGREDSVRTVLPLAPEAPLDWPDAAVLRSLNTPADAASENPPLERWVPSRAW